MELTNFSFVRFAHNNTPTLAAVKKMGRCTAMSKEALKQDATKPKGALRSIDYAAQRLGVKPTAVRSWIYRRDIEFIKVGRLVRIADDVIERLITEGTVPARKRA